jgi:hypothetical protein
MSLLFFKLALRNVGVFIPSFGTQIVNEPFIKMYLLNIHHHASNMDKC